MEEEEQTDNEIKEEEAQEVSEVSVENKKGKDFFKDKSREESGVVRIDTDALFDELKDIEINDVRPDNPLILKFAEWYKQRLQEERIKYDYSKTTIGGKEFYIEPDLKDVLNHFYKSVKRKFDFVILCTGLEGCGKSSFARMLGFYLTKKYNPQHDFTLDNIVFTVDQFNKALDEAKVGTVILWDEFVLGGYSEDMSALQTTLIKKFTLIRKKRLFIILVIPNIWMLRSYFAIARTKILIDIYSPDFVQRGFFRLWGYQSKLDLYFQGTMTGSKWQYKIPPDIYGRFWSDIAQDDFFVNTADYEAKKDAAIESIDPENVKEAKRCRAKKSCKKCKNPYMNRDIEAQMFRCGDCGYAEPFPDID